MRISSRNFRDSAAAAALATAMASALIAAPAAAQSADDAAEEVSEIVVTGSIAESQAASLAAKRRAENLVDIAAADAVGRFPDQNSAAALSRLPAVAVQRDQGQERYVQVRGAPNRWTSVSIDGIPIIGVDEGGATRAFRFDAIPSVILSALAINKSLTPDLPAEAIVANIDLRTYNPLSKRGFSVQGDVGYGVMALGNGEQRQGSLRLAWANDVVGVVVGGSHYRRAQVTDNREVGAYDERGATEIDVRSYNLVRQNNGAFAGVEYAPADGQRLFAKAIFSEFADDELRDQYEFRLDRAAGGTRTPAGGDLLRVPVRTLLQDGSYRTRNYINTIGGELDQDGWRVAVNLNYTRTENTTDLPILLASTSGNNSPSLNFDRSNPDFPIVTLFQTLNGPTPGTFVRGAPLTAINPATLVGPIALVIDSRIITDSYTVKMDAERELGSTTLSAGAIHADRTIDGDVLSATNVAPLAALPAIGRPGINLGDFATNRPWVTRFPLGTSFNYIDNGRLRTAIDQGIAGLTAAGLFNPAANVPPENAFAIREYLTAAYVKGRFDFGGGQVVAGLRLENFRVVNSGNVALGGGRTAPLTTTTSTTDLFPSINAKFDVGSDFVVRIGGQRGVARPSFGEIRTGAAISDTASPGTISGGNPNLRPEYTWGLDASAEYYLPGNGIFAVSGFYRWVDNVLFSSTSRVGSDFYNSGGVDRSAYLLTSTFNGDKGKLYGVELNYQQQFSFLPSPLDGLGFQGNVTLLDGSFDTALGRGAGFPGTSKQIFNSSLYYEKYGLSARISYQYRSDWLDTLGGFGTAGGDDEFRKGYDNLDISLRYALTDNFTLFADLNNLTNAQYIAFQGTRDRPTEVEQIGRRYLGGVRFSF